MDMKISQEPRHFLFNLKLNKAIKMSEVLHPITSENIIHVVEYSHVEKLQSELKRIASEYYRKWEDQESKILRLQKALEKCKEQRDKVHMDFWDDVCPEWVFEQDNAELESILDGR